MKKNICAAVVIITLLLTFCGCTSKLNSKKNYIIKSEILYVYQINEDIEKELIDFFLLSENLYNMYLINNNEKQFFNGLNDAFMSFKDHFEKNADIENRIKADRINNSHLLSEYTEYTIAIHDILYVNLMFSKDSKNLVVDDVLVAVNNISRYFCGVDVFEGYCNNIDQSTTSKVTVEESTINYGKNKTYLPGYEDDFLYNELMKYEKCTDPEEMKVLLSNVLGEDVSYYFLDYKDGLNEDYTTGFYYEPYSNYICEVNAVYKVDKCILPVESDTYVFWGEQSLKTYFIMNSNGSYLVSKHESTMCDDGTIVQNVVAWLLSDLYLSSHGYINESDSDKEKYRQMCYGIDAYDEFERILSPINY